CFEQVIQFYTARFLQSSTEFESLAIGSDDCRRVDRSNPESHKIVKDGSGCAGLATDPDDIVHRQIGFDGGFLETRVDFEITMEADGAKEPDAQLWEARSDFL